jgi:hypothetical protein
MSIHDAEYGLWRAVYQGHAYKGIRMDQVPDATRNGFPTGALPKEDDFPRPLEPVDDLPPVTVVTHVQRNGDRIVIRGTTADNGTVKRVIVNGTEAKALTANFGEWETVLKLAGSGAVKVTAHAEDAAGNVENRPHVLLLK